MGKGSAGGIKVLWSNFKVVSESFVSCFAKIHTSFVTFASLNKARSINVFGSLAFQAKAREWHCCISKCSGVIMYSEALFFLIVAKPSSGFANFEGIPTFSNQIFAFLLVLAISFKSKVLSILTISLFVCCSVTDRIRALPNNICILEFWSCQRSVCRSAYGFHVNSGFGRPANLWAVGAGSGVVDTMAGRNVGLERIKATNNRYLTETDAGRLKIAANCGQLIVNP